MFQDRAKIWVQGGGGGNGVSSFRREAHVPRGGPDGGDGGRGGDVVVVADDSLADLGSLRRHVHHRARRGGHGEGAQRHGARGEDRIVRVPPGTAGATVDGARFDLTEPGQRAVVARGGLGGRGNRRFAGPTRRAPRFAEQGSSGEEGWIELQLKLLADVGLVGMPNAGKSSLLGRLTRADPKVAAYPFTTTEPVLGAMSAGDRQLIVADVPGLIEGAAEGVGLGHEFLAHVERCRTLAHVVDVSPAEGDPAEAHALVRAELAAHDERLAALPELLVLNKLDLLPAERRAGELDAWRRRLGDAAVDVVGVSAATGEGLDELRAALARAWASAPAAETGAPAADGFAFEHRTYRPGGVDGYAVVAVEDGVWELRGPRVDRIAERHDLDNPDALSFLEERLHAIGAVRALRAAGFDDGDELQLGDVAFEFWPDR